MARTAVGTSWPRVWCYGTSERTGGVSMVGMANEQLYGACEDTGGDITSSCRAL